MGEERFTGKMLVTTNGEEFGFTIYDEDKRMNIDEVVDLLNEQQELIEELHISDHMGWGRAEKFEKELKQKKIYIKRLEYKVQKFKEMNGEQQDTISKLIEELELTANTKLFSRRKLEEENKQMKKQLEQMYLNKLDKRERQIDIMKFHILNFCTDEQIQSIKNDLEIESKLRRCKK